MGDFYINVLQRADKLLVREFKDGKINGKGVLFKVNGEIQSGIWNKDLLRTDTWTIEAVSNYLKNRYPQFKGFD